MLVVLAVASTVPHPDLALERIAPPPRSKVRYYGTPHFTQYLGVLCHKICTGT